MLNNMPTCMHFGLAVERVFIMCSCFHCRDMCRFRSPGSSRKPSAFLYSWPEPQVILRIRRTCKRLDSLLNKDFIFFSHSGHTIYSSPHLLVSLLLWSITRGGLIYRIAELYMQQMCWLLAFSASWVDVISALLCSLLLTQFSTCEIVPWGPLNSNVVH